LQNVRRLRARPHPAPLPRLPRCCKLLKNTVVPLLQFIGGGNELAAAALLLLPPVPRRPATTRAGRRLPA